MELRERSLYHQIHPVKLLTDWLTAAFSAWLFWYHHLWTGLAVGVVPPVAASALLLRYADLEPSVVPPSVATCAGT
jgi:hypothetical protein